MLSAFNVNSTEARQIALEHGYRVPRHYSIGNIDDILCNPVDIDLKSTQLTQRAVVQRYCEKNWDTLQEVLRCEGNCAENKNSCTDTQASVCFYSNSKYLK